jgi:prevent-host-death family protein
MAYTVHQAKTHLSRLLKEAEAGQEVTILRGKKPVAKLVPIEEPKKQEVPFRLMGAYPGISWTPGAFDPLTDEELNEMGFDYLVDVPRTPMPEKPASEK